jgi:beta-phosphoglucomutase family hydrolase
MIHSEILFPDPGFEALIFDLDGTLVDSMPAHFQCWCLALADQGAENIFTEDAFYAMGGLPTRDIVGILNKEKGLNLDPTAVSLSKKNHYLKCLDQVELVTEVVDYAKAHWGKIPLAVASGGGRIVVEKTLEILGLSELFDAVVTANDVIKGKPAPDIFLETARRLGVVPGKCVVFEDAVAGVDAARAAGMEVVRVPTRNYLNFQ